MDRDMLEFLFVGPLFSIFKGINQIRRDIMGLKEQIDGYTSRVDAVAADFRSELSALQDKLNAAGAVDPDVQASLDNLGQHLTTLEGVETPDTSTVPSDAGTGTAVGSVVDPTTITSVGQAPASDSPGEPAPVDDSGSASDTTSTDTTDTTTSDTGAADSTTPPLTDSTAPVGDDQSGSAATDSGTVSDGTVPPENV